MKIGKIIGAIFAVIFIIVAGFLIFMKVLSYQVQQEQTAALDKLKVQLIEGVNDLEYQYGQELNAEVAEYHESVDDKEFSEYVIYYPASLTEVYPIVVWGNGSQGTYKDYEVALRSLASYGFVVVGNDHELTGNGESIYEMALYAVALNENEDSIFYGKLNTSRIGVGGHSQGACGAVNAATKYENSEMVFKSLFTTSMPKLEMCKDLFDYWKYDASKITMPYFATSGVGSFDLDIVPLESMQENSDAMPRNVFSVYARRKDADHNIVAVPCGYMNAWFCWTLKGDSEAGRIFTGENAEIKINANWQDVLNNK